MNIKDFEALYGSVELAVETDLSNKTLSLHTTTETTPVKHFNTIKKTSPLNDTDTSLEGLAKLIQNKQSSELLTQTLLPS
ncbi:MAG: hypothetical protein Q4B28_05985 [bacterium]|nr:hypothetical protein [bacterium]